MANNQYFGGQVFGFTPALGGTSPGTFPLSAALGTTFSNSWFAFGFVPDQSKSITEFSVFISAVTSTAPGATDLQCDIFSDSGGSPNTSLVSSTSSGAGAVAANTWRRFALAATALTAGTQYWGLIRNANGSPTTIFPTIRYCTQAGNQAIGGFSMGTAAYGNYVKTTNTGAAPWSGTSNPSTGYRIGYSDGSYAGAPMQNIGQSSNPQAAWGTGSNQVGVRFTVPNYASLNIRGCSTPVFKAGSPTGGLAYNLWTGANPATLIDTTYTIPAEITAQGSFKNWLPAYFSSTHSIPPGTVVRLTLTDLATDSLSVNYNLVALTMDSDVNSLPLLPVDGTWQGTYGTGFSGGNTIGGTQTFTDQGATPIIYPFAALLDTGGEFGAVNTAYSRSRVIGGI